MAAGKLFPRQKMIGMMYLVLTALLALQVSTSILDAFVTQNDQAIEQHNSLIQNINKSREKVLSLKYDPSSKESATKVDSIMKMVEQLSNTTDDFYVNELNALFKETENEEQWFSKNQMQITHYKNFEKMKKREDYDTPSRLFGGTLGSNSYNRGQELRKRLIEYRDELILTAFSHFRERAKDYYIQKKDLVDLSTFENALEQNNHPHKDLLLTTYKRLTKAEKIEQNGSAKDWNIARFYHQPIVGVVGTFTSLRNDIRLSQQDIYRLLISKIDEPIVTINKIEPKVLVDRQYFNQGESTELKIAIVAYDSTKNYPIRYKLNSNGEYVELDSSNFILNANGVGNHTLEGELDLDIAGISRALPWKFNYTVGKPTGAIEFPEYNILYRKYPNKIIATASGYDSKDISISCSNCQVESKDNNGNAIIKANTGNRATITLRAKGKVIAKREYSIKNAPLPYVELVGVNDDGESISLSRLRTSPGLRVGTDPSSPIGIKYDITHFELGGEGTASNSLQFTSQQKNEINRYRRGQKIFISNIRARSEYGQNVKLSPIVLEIR